MKTVIILLFAAIMPLMLLSQTVVSADKMNVMYRGMENPITIAVAEQPSSALYVTATNARIFPLGQGRYIVTPGPENTVGISVIVKNKDNSVLSRSETFFRVLPVPVPSPYFAGKNSGTISKAEIQANPVLSIKLENFLFENYAYFISGFTISYPVGKSMQRDQVNGDRMNNSLIEKILTLKSGTKLYLDEIKATGPDGNIITLQPITLTLE